MPANRERRGAGSEDVRLLGRVSSGFFSPPTGFIKSVVMIFGSALNAVECFRTICARETLGTLFSIR